MALAVKVAASPAGPYDLGSVVTLTATITPRGDRQVRWLRGGNVVGDLGTARTLVLTLSGDTRGEYVAQITPTGDWKDAVSSNAVAVVPKPTAVDDPNSANPDPAEAQETLVFSPRFAAVAAAVLFLVGFVALWSPARAIGRFTWGTSATSAAARVADVGSVIGLGLLVIGGVALLGGIWMAVVEFRGRMRTSKSLPVPPGRARGGVLEAAPGIIDALSKLKGPTAVLVIACIPLLAAAWIARGAVEAPSTTTTTTSVAVTTTLPTFGTTTTVPPTTNTTRR